MVSDGQKDSLLDGMLLVLAFMLVFTFGTNHHECTPHSPSVAHFDTQRDAKEDIQ